MMLQKRLEPLLSRKRVAILEACIIGVVSGLAAVSLKQGVEWLTLWRTSLTYSPVDWLPLIGLVGGWLSGWLVERLAPRRRAVVFPR
jgi:CIC family chloride channel protein